MEPSGVLKKLIPKDPQTWLCGLQESRSETWSGFQGEEKIPRGHPGGRFLKEAAAPAGGSGKGRGEGLLGKGPLAPPGSKAGRKKPGLQASGPPD